ncbi:N,N-dimethylformamidase beta subunit family domain-containing protein [Kitasatospora azatica]|uniref:N,N-dimethylformamidase beta subunit family domain-containing protein n=1 Tax=Kitasatospora azatica TaxID=58347 RepID=UPI0005625CEE|nr:N,N-dimethylformamidase beta subunit family domain-containing protein [Kitasatospora azatica]
MTEQQSPDGQRGKGRRRFLGLAGGAAAGMGLAACGSSGSSASGSGSAGASSANRPAAGAGSATGNGTTSPNPPRENDRPGNPDWRIGSAGPDRAIEGWADRVSVLPGESFGLHVSTTAPGFKVTAYRMGWYGGARGRQVWQSDHLPGTKQPAATVDKTTRMVATNWPKTTTVPTTGWPEGSYLLRLDADGGAGQRYVPVTVRSASTAGKVVVVNAVATWQAYNEWGGYNLYNGPTGGYPTRSLVASFDRPYQYADGAGLFLVYEAPLIALAEKLGLPLAYTTSTDLAAAPDLLKGATAVLSPGHDEYWSQEQRAHVTAARDAGTNVAILGANCCYRRVRYEPSPTGPDRQVVCYKTSYQDDPGFKAGKPPTNDFRAQPQADPESSLLGVIYDGYPVDAPYVVTNPGHWLFAGTGAKAGDSFAHLVGVEYDRVNTSFNTPRPIEILAHSPVVCEGRKSFSDTAFYAAPSGAGVFASGTMRWVEALDATGDGSSGADHSMDAKAGALTQKVTENLLTAFAAGPAGKAHPPQDNVAAVYGGKR